MHRSWIIPWYESDVWAEHHRQITTAFLYMFLYVGMKYEVQYIKYRFKDLIGKELEDLKSFRLSERTVVLVTGKSRLRNHVDARLSLSSPSERTYSHRAQRGLLASIHTLSNQSHKTNCQIILSGITLKYCTLIAKNTDL